MIETAKLKEQIDKKTAIVLRLKEEKMTRSRSASRNFTKQDLDDEKEELQNKVQALEEKMKRMLCKGK